MLKSLGFEQDVIERVSYLVGHHHTYTDIDGIDYQILIEADYIVNACESGYSKQNISDFMDKIMKTASGKEAAKEVFHV